MICDLGRHQLPQNSSSLSLSDMESTVWSTEDDEEGEEEDDAEDEEGEQGENCEAHAAARITIDAADIPQAFSCWSYWYTKRQYLVCDLQGVLDMKCRPPLFELTDPVIHTTRRRGEKYGRTNRGRRGVTAFFKTHKCSELCRSLKKRWVSGPARAFVPDGS
jgi:hypothetical protein